MDPSESHSIVRRQAQSGRASYGDPLVLHESNRTRVVLVPFYISRTHGRHGPVDQDRYLPEGRAAPRLGRHRGEVDIAR